MSQHGSDPGRRRQPRRRATQSLVFGLVLLAVTACSSADLPRLGLPAPATEQGPRVVNLWQGSWAAALLVGAAVWGLIIWSVIFHRRRGDGLPVQTRYNVPIEVLYTVVPFIIIAVLFYFTARDENELLKLSDNPDHKVNVVGRQWSWSFNYLTGGVWDAGTPANPPTLVLPEGETVQFELTATDVIHSFWVPAFLFKLDVVPGQTNRFEITPSKQGTYVGKCAELCGQDHARMLFNVKVVSPTDYQQHLAALRAEGNTGTLPKGVIAPGHGFAGKGSN